MSLQLYLEQLKSGKQEAIDVMLPSHFLEIEEKEVTISAPIHLKGQAYVTDNHLVLQVSAHTEVKIPCSICNDMTLLPLKAEEIFYSVALEDLTTSIFDFSPIVREELILLIPQFIECQGGTCPERKNMSSYLKNSSDHHFPFADL